MNWDDAKYFLAVARAGQMLGAAERLNVSQAKLSRRVGALEEQLGAKLFERSTGGCRLTGDGNALMDIAERVEAEFQRAQEMLNSEDTALSGPVRIGVPDGFGTAYLSARLHLLSEQHPNLQVQLVPTPRGFSLSQREADIAVMVGRPEKGRLRIRKLTDYSLSLYASREYLEKHGMPRDLQDLRDHRLVGYVEDLIYSEDLKYAEQILRDWRSNIEISSAQGQVEAVRAGAGVGVLHDFMVRGDGRMLRLLPERRVMRTYWTVWHESMRNIRRVQAVAEFLNRVVLPDRDWFIPAD